MSDDDANDEDDDGRRTRRLRLRTPVPVVLYTADVRWIDPPPKTLPPDQIITSYVKLFLNNEKKPQMDGLVRRPNRLGGSIQHTSSVWEMNDFRPKNACMIYE